MHNTIKTKKKKMLVCILLCFITAIMMFPMEVKADMGPKDTIYIEFENMGNEVCYGTLLCVNARSSCRRAWDGEEIPYDVNSTKYEIWKAFVDYQDPDGYYFQQEFFLCSKDKCIDWFDGTPNSFKILLYYPERDVFVSSEICNRYAFASYYTVDMAGIEIGSDNAVLIARNSYDYKSEIIGLVVRIILTILIELGIAFLFMLHGKRVFICIIVVNFITQLVLNFLLNYEHYVAGGLTAFATYFFGELIVFIIEAVLYSILLPRMSNKKIRVWRCILYALVANIVSLVSGIVLANYLFVI